MCPSWQLCVTLGLCSVERRKYMRRSHFFTQRESLGLFCPVFYFNYTCMCTFRESFRLYYWVMPVQIYFHFTSEWCLARSSSDYNVKWAITVVMNDPSPKEDRSVQADPPNILDVLVAYKLPYPGSSIAFWKCTRTAEPSPSRSPQLKNCQGHPQIFISNRTPTIPRPYICSHPHPQIFIFCNTPCIPTFFLTLPWGHLTKENMADGDDKPRVGWGGGGVGGQFSAVQENCALAKLWHTRIVCDNCALQTYLYGAHCVPE